MTPSRIAALLSLLVGGALSILAPDLALEPGEVGPGHQTTPCLSCHRLGRGIPVEACVACHRRERVSERLDAGSPLLALHATVEGCRGCHQEHGGTHRADFSHQALPAATRGDCQACHAPPDTPVHAVTRDCAACHGTETWKGATVDHARFGKTSCESCHAKAKPTDALHAEATACGACHTTTAWKPATLDHAKYFPLEGPHAVACAECHTKKGDFTSYDCTTCHEHSPARLARQHDEEGLTDLRDCVRCHRDGKAEGEDGEEE